MTKIMICGATGLIGKALVSRLRRNTDKQLILVGRDLTRISNIFGKSMTQLTWSQLNSTTLPDSYIPDTVINLAGENIGTFRWTPAKKNRISNSRISCLETLNSFFEHNGIQPRLLNVSGIGIYGLKSTVTQQNETEYDENSDLPSAPQDFLAEVGRRQEQMVDKISSLQCKVVKIRLGVVLAKQGGMLAKLLPSFKLGCGAILGTGQQPLSWVYLDDAVAALEYLLDNPLIEGPVNIVAPETVSQKQFAQCLAKQLGRPCLLMLPSSLVRLLWGELGNDCLLRGMKVVSKRLQESGFEFYYPTLQQALEHLLT